MSAAQPVRPVRPRLLQLPPLSDRQIPAWRFTRHAVAITFGIFACLVATALVVSTVVTMKVTIDGSGILEPVSVWPVRPAESGVLSQILVRTGDTVRAGQIIARLDPIAASSSVAEFEAQIRTLRIEIARLVQAAPIDSARLRAEVISAEARLAGARTALRQRMLDFGISGNPDSIAHASARRVHVGLDAPSADFVAAEAAVEVARVQAASSVLGAFDVAQKRSELSRLESQLGTSRRHLARQEIRAPASGVVLTDQTEQLAGSALAGGQTFLEIADVGRWRVTLGVAERDVHQLHVGDSADLEILAFAANPEDHFRGRVESVGWQPVPGGAPPSSAAAPAAAGSASGYRVLVQLDASDLTPAVRDALRRGYAVNGKIVVRSARAASLLLESFRERVRNVAR